MKMTTSVALSVAMLLFAATGCVRKTEQQKDLVLAIVGQKEIKESDFRTALDRLDPSLRSKYSSDRLAFLDNMIADELIYQQAVEKNIPQTPEAKKRLARAEQRTVIERLEEQEVYSNVTVTREEIESRYLEEIARPEGSGMVKSILYLSSPPEDKTKNLGETIKRGLREGLSFPEIARQNSLPYEGIAIDSPSFHDLREDIRTVALKMNNKTGIAANIGGRFFYFFKDAEPLSSCFRRIRQVIRDEKREKALREWLSAQRARSTIRKHEEALNNMAETDAVAAEVNGVAVTVGDVASLLEDLPAERKNEKLSDKAALLDQAIDTELLRQEAWKRNFQQDKDVKQKVAAQSRLIVIDLMTEQAVTGLTRLAREDSRKEWVEQLRKTAGVKVFAENVNKMYIPPAEEIREIFGTKPV